MTNLFSLKSMTMVKRKTLPSLVDKDLFPVAELNYVLA